MDLIEFSKILSADFDVQPIAVSKKRSIFCKRRPKVWHFVENQDNGEYKSVGQWHLTRYEVARACSAAQNKQLPFESVIDSLFMERFGFHFLSGEVLPDFARIELGSDVEKLKKSQSHVEKISSDYCLPEETTPNGNSVSYSTKEFLEAIAFEKLIHGKLDAMNFGFFSAFCTFRDFFFEKNWPYDLTERLVDGQLEYVPDDLSEEHMNISEQIQSVCLENIFWGRGVMGERENFINAVQERMSFCTPIQQTQFALSNGMQTGSLILPLGLACGVLPIEAYTQLLTLGLQPDSPEEQELRTDAAFIYGLKDFDIQ